MTGFRRVLFRSDFTLTGLTIGETYSYERYTIVDGTNWSSDTTNPSGSLPASQLAAAVIEEGEVITPAVIGVRFTLKHNEKIVFRIPAGTHVTVREEPGFYTPSYTYDGNVYEGAEADLILNTDYDLAFTNNMDAPSPTGLRLRWAPYALMLATGLLLALPVFRKRRRRGKA